MTLFANTDKHGGALKTQIASELRNSKRVNMAVGYVSGDILKAFEPNIKRIVRNGGNFNLIIGMAFFEGTTGRTLKKIRNLHEQIRTINPNNDNGIKFTWERRYHGKIYQFVNESCESVYVGSSNFSDSGLSNNLEATVSVDDENTKRQVVRYLEWLNSPSQSVYVDQVPEIVETDSQRYRNEILSAKLSRQEASEYDVSTLSLDGLEFVDISLSRIDKQSKSNLNCYFAKGRLQRSTGIVTPRNWFEVEIIVDQETTRNPIYPRGVFKVITDDGFTFECQTQSASNNYKNLRSKHGLSILGKWIKMKLQNADALYPLTPTTSETLERFGKDYIRLYKITDGSYFMEFKPS